MCLCAAIHPPLLFSLQKYPSSSSHRASDVVVHGFLTFKPRPANHNAVTEKPDGTQKLPEEVLNSYLLKTGEFTWRTVCTGITFFTLIIAIVESTFTALLTGRHFILCTVLGHTLSCWTENGWNWTRNVLPK